MKNKLKAIREALTLLGWVQEHHAKRDAALAALAELEANAEACIPVITLSKLDIASRVKTNIETITDDDLYECVDWCRHGIDFSFWQAIDLWYKQKEGGEDDEEE